MLFCHTQYLFFKFSILLILNFAYFIFQTFYEFLFSQFVLYFLLFALFISSFYQSLSFFFSFCLNSFIKFVLCAFVFLTVYGHLCFFSFLLSIRQRSPKKCAMEWHCRKTRMSKRKNKRAPNQI